MATVGSDQQSLAASTGGVIDADGAMLLSTDTTGETSLMFGPASTRAIVSGVENGDWGVPPADPTSNISDTNPMPYWTFADSSSGAITAAVVTDTGSASGNALRFTIANNTGSGNSAQISRMFPITSSKSRSLWQGIEVTVSNITSTANAKLTGRIDFYANDQSTQVYPGPTTTISLAARALTTATITTAAAHYLNVGDSVVIAMTSGPTGYAALNGTYTITATATATTFTYTTTTSGTVTSGAAVGDIRFYSDLGLAFNAITTYAPDNSIQIPNYITGGATAKSGTPPPTAAYARAVITISTTANVTPAASIDINEVRNIRGFQEIVVNDSTDPQSYAPVYINNSYGIATIANGATTSGQQAQVVMTNGITGGGTVTVSSNLSVPQISGSAGNVLVGGNIGLTGSFYGSTALTGPSFQLTGTTGVAWVFSNASGAADVLATNSTTRAGVLVTKSTAGQPSTVVNGTATTDAFADALRNGGLASDNTNGRFYVYNGSAWKYAALTTPSDSRLKEEITSISGALDTLRQLVPVAFKWKRPEAHQRTDSVDDNGKRLGFIADQVATTDLKHWVEDMGVGDIEHDLVADTDGRVLAVNIPQNEMEALVVQALLDIDTRLKALEAR